MVSKPFFMKLAFDKPHHLTLPFLEKVMTSSSSSYDYWLQVQVSHTFFLD